MNPRRLVAGSPFPTPCVGLLLTEARVAVHYAQGRQDCLACSALHESRNATGTPSIQNSEYPNGKPIKATNATNATR